MNENLKRFLEKISADKELVARSNSMSKEDLLNLANELGIELSMEDFDTANQSGAISDEELTVVTGGGTQGGLPDNHTDFFRCFSIASSYNDGNDCICVAAGGGVSR